MPNIVAVKSCTVPTQHKEESEQDFAENWLSTSYAAMLINFGESFPSGATNK
jgi:hypothetical protein